MFDWLKRYFSNNEVQEINRLVPASRSRSEIEGLNFASAIESHLRWKARLADYIAGRSTETLDVAVIACDDKCVLGQWLYSTGKQKFGSHSEFERLRVTHAIFHRCASDVVRFADAGEQRQALEMITAGDYAKTSAQVIRQLSALWKKVSGG
jgi:hypothetical protein